MKRVQRLLCAFFLVRCGVCGRRLPATQRSGTFAPASRAVLLTSETSRAHTRYMRALVAASAPQRGYSGSERLILPDSAVADGAGQRLKLAPHLSVLSKLQQPSRTVATAPSFARAHVPATASPPHLGIYDFRVWHSRLLQGMLCLSLATLAAWAGSRSTLFDRWRLTSVSGNTRGDRHETPGDWATQKVARRSMPLQNPRQSMGWQASGGDALAGASVSSLQTVASRSTASRPTSRGFPGYHWLMQRLVTDRSQDDCCSTARLPRYTLYYWPVPGRGVFVRSLFAFTGTPFNEAPADEVMRILATPFSEQPIPLRAPPLLVDNGADGFALSQLLAVCTYVADNVGMMPENLHERSLALKVLADANDVFLEMCRVNGELELNGTCISWEQASWDDFRDRRFVSWLQQFEALAARHACTLQAGFLLGTPLPTLADLACWSLWATLERCMPELAPLIHRHAPIIMALCRRLERKNGGALAALAVADEARSGNAWCGGRIEENLREVVANGRTIPDSWQWRPKKVIETVAQAEESKEAETSEPVEVAKVQESETPETQKRVTVVEAGGGPLRFKVPPDTRSVDDEMPSSPAQLLAERRSRIWDLFRSSLDWTRYHLDVIFVESDLSGDCRLAAGLFERIARFHSCAGALPMDCAVLGAEAASARCVPPLRPGLDIGGHWLDCDVGALDASSLQFYDAVVCVDAAAVAGLRRSLAARGNDAYPANLVEIHDFGAYLAQRRPESPMKAWVPDWRPVMDPSYDERQASASAPDDDALAVWKELPEDLAKLVHTHYEAIARTAAEDTDSGYSREAALAFHAGGLVRFLMDTYPLDLQGGPGYDGPP